MFPRITRVESQGKTYEYLRLVETHREHGRTRQRVVANLGRVDQLREQNTIDDLIRLLRRFSNDAVFRREELEQSQAPTWGTVLVARNLWDELCLPGILRECCGRGRREFDLAETAFVLVASRLARPSSEHGLGRWLEEAYVCSSSGQRWLPDWRPVETVTPESRVRIQPRQLAIWYRTLDALVARKEKIEEALYLQLRDLFSIKVDLIFYDITSLYFEGEGPPSLARRGHSRDGKPRNTQIVLGLVMANGFPIASHVFPGNTLDQKTVGEVVGELERRFGIRQIIFVGDRGMPNADNLRVIKQAGQRYLFGLKCRRNPEAWEVLQRLGDRWEECGRGTKVQEVVVPGSEARYFVAMSEERIEYERGIRLGNMKAAQEELDKIVKSVEGGDLNDPVQIGKRVGRASAVTKVSRYFSWEAGPGAFRYWEDPQKMAKELAYEGRYVLETTDPTLTGFEAVEAYKELSDVEWAFRELKDIIEGRPIWHQKPDRVRAHVFVATLSLLLMRLLRRHLADKGLYLSPPEALRALETVKVYTIEVEGKEHRIVPNPRGDARRVLKALGVGKLDPPVPPGAS